MKHARQFLTFAIAYGIVYCFAATLVWSPTPNVAGYSVESGTNPGAYQWQKITTNTNVRVTQPPPAPGVTGYYTVRSFVNGLTSPPTYELWLNLSTGANGTNFTQRGVLESTIERAQTLDGQWFFVRTNAPLHFTNTSQCFYRIKLKINLY